MRMTERQGWIVSWAAWVSMLLLAVVTDVTEPPLVVSDIVFAVLVAAALLVRPVVRGARGPDLVRAAVDAVFFALLILAFDAPWADWLWKELVWMGLVSVLLIGAHIAVVRLFGLPNRGFVDGRPPAPASTSRPA
jgi:hypothetical protein